MTHSVLPAAEERDTGVGRGSRWRMHVMVFCVALVSRLAFQAGLVGLGTAPRDDAALYDSIAVSVSHGGPYVDSEGYRSRRAPGFTLLLAGLYALTGHSWPAARLLQALLGAATCSLLLSVGNASLGEPVGRVAALACAVFPYTVYWSGYLLTETLCALLVTASTWSVLRAGSAPRSTAAWAFLCALAALTRPNLGLLFVLGLLWILGRSRRRWVTAAVAVAVFALALLPWMVRNYVVHGRFVPVTSMGGVVLWEGNNPVVVATPALRGRALTADLETSDPDFRLPELEQDRVLGRRALRFIRDHILDMPGLVASKLIRLWNPFSELESVWQRWLAFLALAPVLVLFGAGLATAAVRRERLIWPLLLPILAVTLSAAIYWADARMRAPADPMILLIASYGLTTLFDRSRRSGGQTPP
jgi:dolichyl-phosphate-mannose-protein mannosyltransferase